MLMVNEMALRKSAFTRNPGELIEAHQRNVTTIYCIIREMSLKAKRALACIAGDRPFLLPQVDRDESAGKRRMRNGEKRKREERILTFGGFAQEAVPLPPLAFS